MNNSKLTLGVALVAVVIAIGAYFYPAASSPFGQASGPQHFQEEAFIQGLQIGPRGSDFLNFLKGTATPVATEADQSVTASSTWQLDIAVTGAKTGDLVFVNLATSSVSGASLYKFGGWSVIGAKASTTAGFITVTLRNQTGAAAVPSATQVGSSSLQYVDIR